MKRLLILSLAIALMVSVGASTYMAQVAQLTELTLTLGVVSYQYEGNAWALEDLLPRLEQDLAVLPAPDVANKGTALPQPGRNEPKFVFVGKYADTAEAQATAIADLVAQGVKGIILAPVADTEPVRVAVGQAILAKVPVLVVERQIPGLEGNLTAYIGLEPFAVGIGWARGAKGTSAGGTVGSSPGRPFYGIVSNMNDPRQSRLTQGLATQAGASYQGTLVVTQQNALDEVKKVIAADKTPLVNYLIVADPALVPEVARAAKEVTAGTDRLVKVGVFGAPENMKQLFVDKQIHMVTSQDHFDMFQRAALQLKMFNIVAQRLETQYIPAQVRAAATGFNYMNYPYDYMRQITFTFDRFWR